MNSNIPYNNKFYNVFLPIFLGIGCMFFVFAGAISSNMILIFAGMGFGVAFFRMKHKLEASDEQYFTNVNKQKRP
jgi:hypothetical protein